MAEDKSERTADEESEETLPEEVRAESAAAPEAADDSAALAPEDMTPAQLVEALEEARAAASDAKDHALRAAAEAENVRRRAQRDVEHAHKFALERFTGELLPVIDSLEKAVEVSREEAEAAAIAEGVELSLKLALAAMEKSGIEQLDPEGQPFDPQFHEAMTMVESTDAEPGSVLKVLQKGYTLNGRLVRAAMVIVAKAPEAR